MYLDVLGKLVLIAPLQLLQLFLQVGLLGARLHTGPFLGWYPRPNRKPVLVFMIRIAQPVTEKGRTLRLSQLWRCSFRAAEQV